MTSIFGAACARSSTGAPAAAALPLPARDLADVSIAELLSAIRKAGEDRFLNPESLTISPVAENLVERMERTIISSLGNVSVKTLATEDSHATPRSGSVSGVVPDLSSRAGE